MCAAELLTSTPFLAVTLDAASSSSALYFSASASMRSISSLERRPFSLVMVILLDFPVVLSAAYGSVTVLYAPEQETYGNVENSVGVDVERDLDLRNTCKSA
jgi:hypothetical protein